MMPVAGPDLWKRLVPAELWVLAAPLPPSFAARPQGGGTAPCDERAVFTAVVYALTSGCAWRHLPPTFGTSPATAHPRFTVWTEAGVWRRLHRAVLDELGAPGPRWTGPRRSSTRPPAAPEGGSPTGPNHVFSRTAASFPCPLWPSPTNPSALWDGPPTTQTVLGGDLGPVAYPAQSITGSRADPGPSGCVR
ncbi:transposase [Streptomyces sp. LARHCF249]